MDGRQGDLEPAGMPSSSLGPSGSTAAPLPGQSPAPPPLAGGDPSAGATSPSDQAGGASEDGGAQPASPFPPQPDPAEPLPGVDPAEEPGDQANPAPVPPPLLDDPLRTAIREEFQKALDTAPRDPREFDFKVSTVKWFGILCAVALVLILVANAYFINQLFETGRKHESAIRFQPMMDRIGTDGRVYELAVENEALNMRNNRSVSALFMRAYTQFLSVTAGMILAMLGAIFVLARVDSRETRAEASWKEFRWLMNTASPGVLLACLGVVLVGFVAYRSITTIDTKDSPVFGVTMPALASARLTDEMAGAEFRKQMESDLEKLRSNQ
ncbi:MAG: hypothetical protein KF694_11515 [Mesorhizobium sp.]|nr:hypothetical protein [Mesorhizobium sp.]